MKMTLKAALIMGAACTAGTSTFAQQSDLPAFLQELEGMSFKGTVSGMDLYSMDGFDAIWLISPDGATAIAGTVFSDEGRDIGAVFSGGDPVTSFEITEAPIAAPLEEGQAGISLLNPDGIFDHPAPSVLTDAEIANMEDGLSLIENDIFGPAGGVDETPVEAAGSDVAVTVTNDAQNALEGLSEDDKAFLMAALVQMLSTVENEVEFKSVVEVWTTEVVQRFRNGEDISSFTGAAAPVEPAVETADATNVSPAPTEGSADQGIVLEQPELTLADQLLDEVRHDALWFGIGNHEAPTVYAFIDPTCPYCARAIVNIGDAISDGEIQLRVALAPVVNRSSPNVISSILQAEAPPIAFMEHEYEWAEGRSPLQPAQWDDLPGEVRDGLIHNVDIMKEYEIPGVPFFIFDTADGARIINGLPTSGATFSTAIHDPYMGNQ